MPRGETMRERTMRGWSRVAVMIVPALLVLVLAGQRAGAAHGTGAPPHSIWRTSTTVALAVRRTIPLTGDLRAWQGIPRYTSFLTNTADPQRATAPTSFSVAWDEHAVYLLVICAGQPQAQITARNQRETPQWWSDDAVESYFLPAPDRGMIHYAVNPAGMRFTSMTAGANLSVYTRVEADRWVAELRIPFDGRPLPPPRAGALWRFKIGREYQKAHEFTLWPAGGDFSAGDNYGTLAFVTRTTDRVPTAVAAPVRRSPHGLGGIANYAVYYGQGEAGALSAFDLAIVQPDMLSPTDVQRLRVGGTRTIGYVSVGEADPGTPYFKKVRRSWLLGKNADWGSYYADATQAGWRDLVVHTLIPTALASGMQGIFLDTGDTVDAFPRTTGGMIRLIHAIRLTYPHTIIVMNRGFSVLNDVASDLDGCAGRLAHPPETARDRALDTTRGHMRFTR